MSWLQDWSQGVGFRGLMAWTVSWLQDRSRSLRSARQGAVADALTDRPASALAAANPRAQVCVVAQGGPKP